MIRGGVPSSFIRWFIAVATDLGLLVQQSATADASQTIPAGYTTYVAGTYEIPSGQTLDIGSGAVFEIG